MSAEQNKTVTRILTHTAPNVVQEYMADGEIPSDVIDIATRVGKGNFVNGIVAIVESYASAMEPEVTEQPAPPVEANDPVLNMIASRSTEPPRAADGMVTWEYIVGSGYSLAMELLAKGPELPADEYDRRVHIIRSTVSALQEYRWNSMAVRKAIEQQIGS